MYPYSILAVDCEMCNLNVLKRTFRHEYDFYSASSSEDALIIMEDKHIDIVMADDCISDMTGMEFLTRIRQRHSDTIRIILTTYIDKQVLADAMDMGYIHGYIEKPWRPEEIKAIVRETLKAYGHTGINSEYAQEVF
jgi:DNA-binding NtrC family response regulator